MAALHSSRRTGVLSSTMRLALELVLAALNAVAALLHIGEGFAVVATAGAFANASQQRLTSFYHH
jgi:hypothetical protein